MKVYVVVRLYDGTATNIAVFSDIKKARKCILTCTPMADYVVDEFELDEVVK